MNTKPSSALGKSISRLGTQLEDFKKDAVALRVEVGAIDPYHNQARRNFDPQSLQELADSIKEIGILSPLLVRPLGSTGRYELLAGERRLRAAKLAGLSQVPVLSKVFSDELAEKVHMAENVQRENLDTAELAERVQSDIDAAGGDLAKVAAKYNKNKSWVSKLSSIARGGDVMASLVEAGATSDRAVLATVASLERKAPDRAKVLSEQILAAPPKANKRAMAEEFMKGERDGGTSPAKAAKSSAKSPAPKGGEKYKTAPGQEPAWRTREGVDRDATAAVLIVDLSPVSDYIGEFGDLSKKFGRPRLVTSVRHPDDGYAIVEFGQGNAVRRAYRADELRLLSVS